MAGFEPAFSSTPSWRIARLSYILSETVPAAGVEPAASAFSARRSHQLSYTGIGQRRRQESNLLGAGLQPAAYPTSPGVGVESQRWDSNPLRPRYECGARPVEHRWRIRVAGGSRTHTTPVHSRVPLPLWVRPQRFDLESNQEFGLRRTA